MELVCNVIFCAFCYYHLLFPQYSLVLSQPVSKDAVQLVFDDIIVLFKIFNFVSTVLSIFVTFLCIFCAKTVLDF